MTAKPQQISTSESDASGEEASTDEQLMAGVQAGDKQAFADLYDRHIPTIYALCKRILHRDSEAEAVVSDVFLEVWRKPHSFDAARGTCRTYLLTLTRSRAIDRWRASATRARKSQDASEEFVDSVAEIQLKMEPSSLVETSERRRAVRTAIDQIDRPQRDVLMLAYFECLTHREIAERLELPLGTVKTRIRSGLGSLRKALVALGESGGL